MLRQHLLDCLAVARPLRRELARRGAPADAALLDVGSGGGLPGVVLAILEPGLSVTCVDTVAKKAGFIRQVAAELRLPHLRAEHARVEGLRPARPFDLITSRAFATLADFVRLTRAALAPRGCWMAMKGAVPDDEIAALPPDIDVFHVEPLTVPGLDARRCLIWMQPKDPA
jgi:16S rRNA (guanine527-N7)-methyltransferase